VRVHGHMARLSAALPLLLLTGCLFSTRKLPQPRGPVKVQTIAPAELVDRLNRQWAAVESLTAKVDIQASVLHSAQGVAKDYTSIPGIILMRKPEFLRVYGMVPLIRTEMFDMVSDGKNFTLYVPSRNKAMEGSNSLKTKSANQLENLRPGFFLDALIVRGLDPDQYYTVITDTDTEVDPSKKHLLQTPEYILSVLRVKPESHEEALVRVVRFHRDDLLPYQQDIYDSDGDTETQVVYGRYADFNGAKFPTRVTIKRPMDEIQIVLTIESVTENVALRDDQFAIKMAPGTEVQKLGEK